MPNHNLLISMNLRFLTPGYMHKNVTKRTFLVIFVTRLDNNLQEKCDISMIHCKPRYLYSLAQVHWL